MNTVASNSGRRRASVLRCAIAGALASVTFFVLCWAGAALGIGSAPHMFVELFTRAEIASAAALLEGGLWSIAFGLIGGVLLAVSFNLTAFLDRG
jgi:hypothetical protein